MSGNVCRFVIQVLVTSWNLSLDPWLLRVVRSRRARGGGPQAVARRALRGRRDSGVQDPGLRGRVRRSVRTSSKLALIRCELANIRWDS